MKRTRGPPVGGGTPKKDVNTSTEDVPPNGGRQKIPRNNKSGGSEPTTVDVTLCNNQQLGKAADEEIKETSEAPPEVVESQEKIDGFTIADGSGQSEEEKVQPMSPSDNRIPSPLQYDSDDEQTNVTSKTRVTTPTRFPLAGAQIW